MAWLRAEFCSASDGSSATPFVAGGCVVGAGDALGALLGAGALPEVGVLPELGTGVLVAGVFAVPAGGVGPGVAAVAAGAVVRRAAVIIKPLKLATASRIAEGMGRPLVFHRSPGRLIRLHESW
ncbi:hypothetical protein KNO15_16980 [Leifsonia shinshuensis]|uniref:hypothetical protein n=1 Tax=Leifsonia shinshuensis TaxID=150026 RepID=UPI001F513924|nr:hypothetical protein [Leifsonia shinshuensis]MCI0158398.1 hypothetical protein [Leifsonia shinshuensis]